MANCRSCWAEIIWVRTARGKHMPIDAEAIEVTAPADKAAYVFDSNGVTVKIEPGQAGTGHLSHFATCPSAHEHRKR